LKGLNKLVINKEQLEQELNEHWELLTEAVQTLLRRHGIEAPYEQLKAFSRGKQITQQDFQNFIEQLDVPAAIKKQLATLIPYNYTGLAEQLAAQPLRVLNQ
jgi:adenylosuccinate lyase